MTIEKSIESWRQYYQETIDELIIKLDSGEITREEFQAAIDSFPKYAGDDKWQ